MIVQHVLAPMAGISTPELVAAVCEEGWLGSFGAGYLSEEATEEAIRRIQSLTDAPFAVNVFVPEERETQEVERDEEAMARIHAYEASLGLPRSESVDFQPAYERQLDVCIAWRVPVISFTFGVPALSVVERLHREGRFVIGTATSVEEAVVIERLGMDAVVAQGIEAGGHRGSFLHDARLPTASLVRLVKEAVSIPVIASGGIATQEEAERHLTEADAVQIGSAFLRATEAATSRVHREALAQLTEGRTSLTRAFTGKWARGVTNRFMEEMKEAPVLPYPLQHVLTSRLRRESTQSGRADYVSLWAGTKAHESVATDARRIARSFQREER